MIAFIHQQEVEHFFQRRRRTQKGKKMRPWSRDREIVEQLATRYAGQWHREWEWHWSPGEDYDAQGRLLRLRLSMLKFTAFPPELWEFSHLQHLTLPCVQHHTRDDLSRVIESSQRLQIALPDPFLRFMTSPDLLERVPSCTDAFFSLSDIVPYRGPGGGYIVRFMNARQGQIAWYLYLNRQGEHCVLVGFPLLDVLHDPESPASMQEQITEQEHTMVREGRGATICAFSFEEFVYRFWIENTIWYKLSGYRQWKPLTRDEHLYLAHYQRKKGSLRPQE